MPKVLVFHREDGRHMAIPVYHSTLASAGIIAGAVVAAANPWLGVGVMALTSLVAYRKFKKDLPDLMEAAQEEYARKYRSEDEDADEYEEDNLYDYDVPPMPEVQPAKVEVPVEQPPERAFYEAIDEVVVELPMTYEAGYDAGYRDGRKRYEEPSAEFTEDSYEHGYFDGYQDGRGHKKRKYFE